MPRTQPASPVELPPLRPEPLKRSHSTASIHSLPTPPPTRKRKRSRSTHSRATDSDSEIDERDASEEEEEVLRHKAEMKGVAHAGSKKRKLLQVDQIAAELSGQAAEEEFWTRPYSTLSSKSAKKSAASTKAGPSSSSRQRSATPERSPSESPPARLLKRNRTGLLSPPQSKRRSSPRVKRFAVPPLILEEPEEEVESLPKTPTRLRTPPPRKTVPVPEAPKKGAPERDTPNNPFLDSDESSGVTETPDAEAGPSTIAAPQLKEKPTLTYVFRGTRTEFINPLYNPEFPETGVDPEGDPYSRLPLEHPDYEADEHVLPTRLFVKKGTRRRRSPTPPGAAPATPAPKKARAKAKPAPAPKAKSEWDTTDEEDNAEDDTLPVLALPRTPPPRRSPRLAAAHKGKETPRPPPKDRSDPAKRAFGVHDRPPTVRAKPRSKAEQLLEAEPVLKPVVEVEEVVHTETKVTLATATPSSRTLVDDEAEEVEEVTEVRETTRVKIAARAPARPASRAKAKAPAKPVVPVEDVEENPFL